MSVGRQLFHSCIKNLTLNKRTTHGLPAVAFISHNHHYIRECDRILLFENGEIVKSGLPNQVLEDLPQQELIEIAKEPISRRNSVSAWSSAYGIDKEIKRCFSLKNVYVTEHGVIEYPVVDGMESTLDDNLDEENEKRGHDEELYAYGSISRSTCKDFYTYALIFFLRFKILHHRLIKNCLRTINDILYSRPSFMDCSRFVVSSLVWKQFIRSRKIFPMGVCGNHYIHRINQYRKKCTLFPNLFEHL